PRDDDHRPLALRSTGHDFPGARQAAAENPVREPGRIPAPLSRYARRAADTSSSLHWGGRASVRAGAGHVVTRGSDGASPSLGNAHTILNFSIPSIGLGNSSGSFLSARTIMSEIAQLRNHFLFDGITYHGACSVEHCPKASSNASM